MREGEASRTAEYMALFRALEHARPTATRRISDPFARAFVDSRLRAVVMLGALPGVGDLLRGYIDRRWPGARTSAVARTRFIDERAEAAIGAGIDQVVLLGAGFDSRPYRLQGWDRVTVFEVDHPDTQARKRRLVGAVPSRVRFVPVDFDRDRVDAALDAAGYEHDHPTLFLWEGVTNYLTESAVDATLRWCAGAAPSSLIVFTYVHRGVLDDPASFFGTARVFDALDASGERWTFGLDPAGLASFLAARGLCLDEDVGAEEYRRRCYGPSAATMRGYEFYRIACAHVPGS
ncbi:MAG TPA: SAM-dependent methyltransferase [Candidatus Binatia bacterium]|nr:SAM-dependent methyltransferase [Candidatus Binatia bacterium]